MFHICRDRKTTTCHVPAAQEDGERAHACGLTRTRKNIHGQILTLGSSWWWTTRSHTETDRCPFCIIQSQVWEEGGIRLCLLDTPSACSKLPCLLGTSTQADAVLSALGNPRGLLVFRANHTHARTCTHTRGLIKALRTNTDQIEPLEKHICVLISRCDSQEYSLICGKKKTLSQHIIGEAHKAKKTSQPPPSQPTTVSATQFHSY